MQKRLILMCGVPGSGKSTWVREHIHTFDGYVHVVSRDEIRFTLVPEGEEYFSREKEVYDKFVEDVKFGLTNASVTIADATHLNEGSRGKLLRRLGEAIKNVSVEIVVIKVPEQTAIAQNDLRQGTRSFVPHSVIRRMRSQLVQPTFEEGFDKIYIYSPQLEGAKYVVLEKERV